jgi:hypothetical protein
MDHAMQTNRAHEPLKTPSLLAKMHVSPKEASKRSSQA